MGTDSTYVSMDPKLYMHLVNIPQVHNFVAVSEAHGLGVPGDFDQRGYSSETGLSWVFRRYMDRCYEQTRRVPRSLLRRRLFNGGCGTSIYMYRIYIYLSIL